MVAIDGATPEYESTGCRLVYVEVGIKDFVERLENTGSMGFLTFNLNTLFILRDANYLDILRLFTKIEGCNVEIFKATGQVLKELVIRELSGWLTWKIFCNYTI